jgi:hypothetical protein
LSRNGVGSGVEAAKLVSAKISHVEKIAAIVFIAIFMAPSVIWVLHDQSVWPWDQAMYGDWTLRTWRAHTVGPIGWFSFMVHALSGNPPLIVWAGQFFVPLRHVTGDFESAMLLLNILSASVTLGLIYVLARRLVSSVFGGFIGIAACASSQLFIGLTHQYLVEIVQCFSATCMMFVAWRAERRSIVRTLALTLGAAALCFLSKASSAPFVLPFLTYIALALFFSTKPKAPLSASDIILLIIAVIIAGMTFAWYLANWQATEQHFIDATTGGIALNYGSPVHVPTKLRFWTSTLSLSLSPFSSLSLCIMAAVILGIATASFRLWAAPFRRWGELSLENGLLFVMALAGTICLTLLGYSFQINEDTRFILPLIPMIAVLLGWSLSLFRVPTLSIVFLVGLTANAVVSHAYSFGQSLLHMSPTPYLLQLDSDSTAKRVLTFGVQATCSSELANRWNIIAVEYVRLNANSANFYAEKEEYATGYRCYYDSLGYAEKNFQHAWQKINALAPAYVLTVAPEKQFPPDFVNIVSRPVADLLAIDPRYALLPFSGPYLLIYRKVH